MKNVRVIASGKAKVTSKGQVTVPTEVRHAMGIEVGDSVVFVVGTDGTRIRKAAPAQELVGVVPAPRADWKTLRRKAWQNRAERIVRSSATRTSSSGS